MSLLTRRLSSDISVERPSHDPAATPSLLYSIIPTRISDRISRLPSIRSTPSLRRSRSSKLDSPPLTRSSPENTCYATSTSTSSSGTSTPPPAYAPGAAALIRPTTASPETDDAASAFSFETSAPAPSTRQAQAQSLHQGSSMHYQHHPSPSMTSLTPSYAGPSESQTGILWKFATQGASLLSLAVSESSAPASSATTDPALSRQLYIHALTYLIRGLPTDLSPEEHLSVRASLPAGVVQPINVSLTQNQHLHITNPNRLAQSQQQQQKQPQQHPPSLLHRLLATVVIWLFQIFQLLLPFLKGGLREAYRYERRWKVSEKVVGRGLDVMDGLGKGGWEVMERVGGMGDGRVGRMVGDVVKWGVEGFVGGVGEGMVEGVGILGGRGRESARG